MTNPTLAGHLQWTADMAQANTKSVPSVERVQAQMDRGEVGPATRGMVAQAQDLHTTLAEDYKALGAQLRSFLTVRAAYGATGNEAGGKKYLNEGG